ncbi:MAG: cytochrome monooxygenase [Actinomycetia bacterium]|nr:cytochrome monooxygenase [Actinomycetes bacterium]
MSQVLDTDIDFLLDDLPDVAGTLRELRAERSWLWGKAFGEPAIVLLSHELVQAAFMAEDVFPSADFYSDVVTEVLGRNLQCMRGDEHKRNRALVSPAFRQRLMPGLVEPLLEPVAHELIDRFEADGEADLVADFTKRYPFIIINRLLGLPVHSEEEVRRWALTMLDIQQEHSAALKASHEFIAFVDPFLQERRTDPGDDLLSTLATTEVEGERLTDEEIFNFLRLLFPAGADTTYLGLGNTLHSLLTNPDQLEIVRSDPAEHSRWAAEEGIRMDPPTAWIPRRNPADVTWHGIDVPAGASIMLGIMSANRDPLVYDDPDEFRVERRPGLVTTFGFGTHFCLGAHLARAELQTALQVILSRLPDLRLRTTDGVRITGTIHHLLRGPTALPVAF